MADILKIYTGEQLNDMFRLYLLARGVGLTAFNAGDKTSALIESNSEIISSIAMDFKEGILKAIPIALYEGLGFDRNDAVASIGYLRAYRLPLFWIEYTGSGTSAILTTTSTTFAVTNVTGAPTDIFSFAYASYPTLDDLITAIDALPNWSATLVKSGSINSTTIYQYTSQEIVGESNYLNDSGFDIMLNTDTAITVTEGFTATIDDLQFSTTAVGTIAAGESGAIIAAEANTAGEDGNIIAEAIDTLNGKGYIGSSIDGVEHVINDSAFSGGEEQETATERQVRFAEVINALNAGTEDGIRAELKKITGVREVGIRQNYPAKGTNTIIVDDGTGTISTTLEAAIEKRLYGDADDILNYPGKNVEGITYTISAPTIVDVDILITIYKQSNVNVEFSEITTAVQSAIESYINTRKLGEDVVLAEIRKIVKLAHSAVYDLDLTSPTSNVPISDNEFARTGSGTTGSVTVTPVTI